MPRAFISFDLNKEREDFELAINASGYARVIAELDNHLRQMYKYEDIKTVKVSDVREKITELMNEYGCEKL